jgi:hypothetical protein
MKTRNCLLVVPILLGALYSCKKDGDKISFKHSSLIVGNWLVYQKHSRVYNISDNALVKDTTINYNATANLAWWFELYNADGNAYTTGKPYKLPGSETLHADTTAFLHYTISGSNLMLKTNGGGSETKPILNLTEIDMELESTYNSVPRIGWGLNIDSTYKFIDEVHYKKQ